MCVLVTFYFVILITRKSDLIRVQSWAYLEHIGSRTIVFFIYTLHLLQIPSDRELCVDVKFQREYYVGAVQAVPVNVYDYYKPGRP